jgi:transcriptional regulator with XRE-family HTH domain
VITPKDIGATVKMLRNGLGLSATALAGKVGISQAQVSRLEDGQHSFRSGTLVKLAKALKVPPFRLFMTEKEWRKWTKR